MQRDQECVNLFLILRTLTGLVGAVVIVLIALGACAIVSFTVPPPSKRCGTPGGPPITAPRIRLSNGSYLAYQEHGLVDKRPPSRSSLSMHSPHSGAMLLSPLVL